MPFRPALAALACLLACGCINVCPVQEALNGVDGGQLSCVIATDCPRPSNVLVCSSTEDELRDCIGCVDAKCVRYRPKACP